MTTPNPKPNFLPPTQKTTPPNPRPNQALAQAVVAKFANLSIKDWPILPDDGPVIGMPLLRKD